MMTVIGRDRRFYVLFALLLLVIGTNTLVYRSPMSSMILPPDAKAVVVGSLIDLAIVAPLLILHLSRKEKRTVKLFITWMAAGLLFARLLIPASLFSSFVYLPIAAVGMEAVIVLAEASLIFMLFWRLPGMVRWMMVQDESPLFSFPIAVKKRIGDYRILGILASECMMFYYAFAVWKKQPPTGRNHFTLHRNTSLIALYVMVIHAIAIETAALHWLIHQFSPLLAIVLLILNLYGIIFFIGDIQAVRMNPVIIRNRSIYVSLGLGKRMVIPFDDIQAIHWEASDAGRSKTKDTISFIASDFETLPPHCVIEFTRPLTADHFFVVRKNYRRAALRLDDPMAFRSFMET